MNSEEFPVLSCNRDESEGTSDVNLSQPSSPASYCDELCGIINGAVMERVLFFGDPIVNASG